MKPLKSTKTYKKFQEGSGKALKQAKKGSQFGWKKTKNWFNTLLNKTVEETKVAGARATEAGKLTALNTQRYKVQRALNDHFHDLGEKIYFLSKRGGGSIPNDAKIRKEFEALQSCEGHLESIDTEISSLRKNTNKKVLQIHTDYKSSSKSKGQPTKKPTPKGGRKAA